MIYLEVENHGSGSKALIWSKNYKTADKELKEKGFKRLCHDLVWGGFDKNGNEVSVMEPSALVISSLWPVTQKEEKNEKSK